MNTKFPIILLAVMLLTACGPKAGPTPAGTLPPIQSAAAQSGEIKVSIAGFAFNPVDLTITIGSTVTWTNNDSASHTVQADDGSWGSGNLVTGDTYSFTFNKTGTYAYHCGVHASMKATITVVAP